MGEKQEKMKAERSRRAVGLEDDGAREAGIAIEEGEKQAAILSAEGVKQEAILTAEGEADAIRAVASADRFRFETVAEGEAEAIRSVYGAIHDGNPSPDLIAIKYLEALGTIADGQATKIFIPAEMSATMGSIGAIAELFQTDDSNGETDKEEAD